MHGAFEAWARGTFGVGPGAEPSHTTMTGARLYVPAASHDAFFERYSHALAAGEALHVVERHRASGPVVVDLDFRAQAADSSEGSAPRKLYAPSDVARFVRRLLMTLPDVFALDPGARVLCYVLEKPARVVRSRTGGATIKDGLHLVVPAVVSRPEAQLVLRKRLLPAAAAAFAQALACAPAGSPSATAEGAYDASVIERNGWLLYGSRKPDEEAAWALTRAFELDIQTEDVRELAASELPPERERPRLFSIRDSFSFGLDVTHAHGEAREEVEALIEERENARQERAAAELAATDSVGPSTSVLSADEPTAVALSRLLAPQRAVGYETWSSVLFAVHNATGGSAAGLGAFLDFSAKADSVQPGTFDRAGCERQWHRYRPPPAGRPRLGVGSLAHWARADSPEAYAASHALRSSCSSFPGSRATHELELEPADAWARRALAMLGIDPGRLRGVERASAEPVSPAARSAQPGARPTVRVVLSLDSQGHSLDSHDTTVAELRYDMATMRVRLVALDDDGAERELASAYEHGAWDSRLPARGPDVGGAHKDCPHEATWFVTRPCEQRACFETQDRRAQIVLNNLDRPGVQTAVLKWPSDSGRASKAIPKSGVRMLHTVYEESVAHFAVTQAAPALGVPLVLFGNHNNVQIIQHNNCGGPAEDPSRPREDRSLAKAWLAFFRALPTAVQEEHRIACDANGGTFYFCAPDTGLWMRRDKVVSAERMVTTMEVLDGGRFWNDVLSPEERRYIGTLRGQTAVLTCLIGSFEDEAFERRLDARLDIVPFVNCVVELATGEARPLRWDDYVSTTTGYAYVPRADVTPEHFAVVEDFYQQVLPVPEEREVFLRAAGAALSGNLDGDKFFIVATDMRDGGNGKSTLLYALREAFGLFAVSSQANFLYACAEAANAHGANDLYYRGRRLATFDETSSDRPLNVAKVKQITGGGYDMVVRGAHERTPTEFTWTATVFIACNEGCVPRFNASDAALLSRMVVVPFRAKFDDAAAAAGEQHAWPKVRNIRKLLRDARTAHVHLLLEAYARYRDDGSQLAASGRLPPGCLRWRDDVASGSDPRMEAMNAFVDSRVRFDLERRDEQRGRRVLGVVRRSDLVDAFKAWLARPEQGASYAPDLLRGAKASELKALADAAMRARGRPLQLQMELAGVKIYSAYRHCELAAYS